MDHRVVKSLSRWPRGLSADDANFADGAGEERKGKKGMKGPPIDFGGLLASKQWVAPIFGK